MLKSKLRKSLFWIHLGIGIASGLVIAMMAITGSIMAFEDEITRAVDSNISRAEVSDDTKRLSVDTLVERAKTAYPGTIFTHLQSFNDPDKAWIIQAGREKFYYIDPYTGHLREPLSTPWKNFFHQTEMLHRWLLQGDAGRDTGKSITGAANLAFFGLCLTGLYLWFPPNMHRRALKSGLVIHWKSKGKARDYNWHKVFGFWALPFLLIITITGSFFSYEWMKNATASLLGPPPPRNLEIPAAFKDHFRDKSPKLTQEEIFQAARGWSTTWDTIHLPLPHKAQRRPERKQHGKHGHHARPSFAIAITESDVYFPRRPSQILISPRSGELIAANDVKNFSFSQKILSSIKGIHTGEAGFLPGKIITFLAAISATILVYTGFALSFRRLKRKLKK